MTDEALQALLNRKERNGELETVAHLKRCFLQIEHTIGPSAFACASVLFFVPRTIAPTDLLAIPQLHAGYAGTISLFPLPKDAPIESYALTLGLPDKLQANILICLEPGCEIERPHLQKIIQHTGATHIAVSYLDTWAVFSADNLRQIEWALSPPYPLHRSFSAKEEDHYAQQLQIAQAQLNPRAYTPIPQRIMMTCPTLGPGGAERQMLDTAKGLVNKGYTDLHIVCRRLQHDEDLYYLHEFQQLPASVTQAPNAYEAYTIYQNAVALLGSALTPLGQTRAELFLRFYAAIIKYQPEVLHCWQDIPEAPLAGIFAGVPTIVISWRSLSPQGTIYFHPTMRPIYLSALHHTHVTATCNSSAGRSDYARWLGIDPKRIALWRNAKDAAEWQKAPREQQTAIRAQYGIPEHAPVVGTVARFSQEKRPLLWLETAKQLHTLRPDIHFLYVGDGYLRNEAEHFIAQHDLGHVIHLAGALPDPKPAYSLFSVFLLTSKIEGLPNCLLEAQLMRIPIVATACGGVQESVLPESSARITETDDPATLAQLLATTLADTAWLEQAGDTGHNFVCQHFNPARMLESILTFYSIADRDDPL